MSESIYSKSPLERVGIVAVNTILLMGSFANRSISPEQSVEAQSSQPADMADSSYIEKEAGGPINLEVPPLDLDMAKRYLSARVRISVSQKSGDESKTKSCAGIHVGGGELVTAGHCTRFTQDDDSERYDVISNTGKDLRAISVERNGHEYTGTAGEHFLDYDDPRKLELDAHVIKVDEFARKDFTYVNLAKGDAKLGDAVYMNSLYGHLPSDIYRGRVIRLPSKDNNTLSVMYRIDGPKSSGCIPGVSGTAVLDSEGRLSGVTVASTEAREVTTDIAKQHNLDLSEVGKTAITCVVVPVSTVRLLVNGPQALAAAGTEQSEIS